MTGSVGGARWRPVAILACAMVLSRAMTASAHAGDGIPWSPLRDEAVVADQTDAIGSGVRQAQGFAEEVPPGNLLRAARPARLLPRGTVGRMHEQTTSGPPALEELPVPSAMQTEGIAGGYCDACGGGGCPNCCGNWHSCGPVSPCCLMPCPRLDPLELFAGVEGFTGPANRGGSGSFGFYEGFNHALGLCNDCLCGQIGARWTQSNFDGSLITPQDRTQVFVTAGLYRRADWGLQFGVVFDYFHDEWDYQVDLGQMRGELGWRFCGCDEVGFRFTAGTSDDSTTINELFSDDGQPAIRQRNVNFEVNDLFAFYYRRQFACGGQGRLFGGFTNHDQGLFGGDVRVPLSPCWSLAADFLYVVPAQDSAGGFAEETWNVAVGVVWTPFARPGCNAYCRPLFDVANNGTFATRLQ